jgi:hypothetical protein
MNKLFVLYMSRDREIEDMQMKLEMKIKEKKFEEYRRDDAFNSLSDILVERRRLLAMVHANMTLMGM